ncbi:Bug family tripartite tricarboxylate transporter substrate binding protein [Ottowia thiooxydans]|uniref:Tripartite-type tricarboxylate transporter receptor subunit TctC n=1 Tax=Ottowia thiooxydans TaxID=219182 RepID=A0ABV2Q666_9BURK
MNRPFSRRELMAAAAGIPVAALPFHAGAQTGYPDRAIRIVVPFAPGGDGDVMARYWARAAAPLSGFNFIIDNKAGAGGVIGASEVARSKPDGYTLLLGTTTTQIVNPLASAKPQYDGLKDFVMVGPVSANPTCVLVHPSVPAKNLQELAALARSQPDKLSYGSAGAGTITNLTGELFKYLNGKLQITHVAYRGGGPAMADVIAGHLQLATPIMSSAVLGHHRSGRVRILAINSPTRLKSAPDIPTAVESGMPDMRVVVFNALFAPANLPRPVLETLRGVTRKVAGDAGFASNVQQAGAEMLVVADPEKYMQEEMGRWSRLIKAMDFKIED